MTYKNFVMSEDGFVGHLVKPEKNISKKAVIVIMGGEKGILPGVKIAERFAQFGITGLEVSLYGAEGLPEGPNQIPLEMFAHAIHHLREIEGIKSIHIYGMSMGTIFAALVAKYLGGIESIILCSPSHVPFEGSLNKKQMTGHSIATFTGKDIPFVKQDFTNGNMTKYVYDEEAHKFVTKMWVAYRNAYKNEELVEKADLHLESVNTKILLIAGTGDEMWPSKYSACYLKQKLDQAGCHDRYKLLVYPNASHLLGVMPDREKNKWIYRMIPIIGIFYKSLGLHRKEAIDALVQSEKEIMNWILN